MSNENSPSLEVPVSRGNGGGVDVDAMRRSAESLIRDYAEKDAATTEAVIKTAEEVLSNAKYSTVKHITASTLSKLVVGAMGDIPTDKLCAETAERVSAFLAGQEDKFLHISRGRNSGFWLRDRLSADELAKLTKTAGSEA
jgi:hypothetical protein